MSQLIKSFCRIRNLIFIETGTDHGREVLWFKHFAGKRFCLSATEIQTRQRQR